MSERGQKGSKRARDAVTGPPINRSEARPGSVSAMASQGPSELNLQQDSVLAESEALDAYSETVEAVCSLYRRGRCLRVTL